MCVGVPEDFEYEVRSALRTDTLRTSEAHDAVVLARARELCAPARARSRRARYAAPLALAASLALVAAVYVRYGSPIADDGRVRGSDAIAAAATGPTNGATLVTPPR